MPNRCPPGSNRAANGSCYKPCPGGEPRNAAGRCDETNGGLTALTGQYSYLMKGTGRYSRKRKSRRSKNKNRKTRRH